MNKSKNDSYYFLFIMTIISFFVFFLDLWGTSLCVAEDNLLSVPEELQEQSNWCWAASSHATLAYYGKTVSQCSIADWTRQQNGWGNDNCCINPSDPLICNQTNLLWDSPEAPSPGATQNILSHWGVSSIRITGPLSQATVVSEINSGRPFLIRFVWRGGHLVVGYGYGQNGLYLDYMDPTIGWDRNQYSVLVSDWSHTLQLTSTPPKVSITSPCNSSCIVTSSPIEVKGSATDYSGSGLYNIIVCNNENNYCGYQYFYGNLSSSYSVPNIPLVQGQNLIGAKAFDNTGLGGNIETITITYNPPDTTPPAPNPMTWATQPYAASSSSIAMVGTTANDSGTPPVSYYFDFVNNPTGGTGGSDSAWQSNTSYTNTGLQANHQYGYQVKARDSASTPNETSYSLTVYKFTLANAPVASSFSNVTQTGIQANWTANGNRSGTEYYSENTTKGTNSGWTTNTYWAGTGLNCATSYSFRVKSRNGDGLETGWTSLGSQNTQSCSCTPSSLQVATNTPSNGFSVSQGSGTPVNATVKDNCGNNVAGATASASFSNGDSSLTLYDDGAHNDGSANDGVYASTWTPNNTGSCTITVTASKAGLASGNNSVSGIVQQGGQGGSVLLPRTGQTTCFDSSGNVVTCVGTGQDGELQEGVTWPNPRFTILGDCITDNLTGLMWPKNANLAGLKTWAEALDYANNLTLCGYSDWRLPNRKELRSLVNYQQANPATWLGTQSFNNVQADTYWASTTDAPNNSYVWTLYLNDGTLFSTNKTGLAYAWPARTGQSGAIVLPRTGQTTSYAAGDDGNLQGGVVWPNPRFAVIGDCITDNLTGLMWSKNANLAGLKTWAEALDYANNLTLCGYSDWRLPDVNESESLSNANESSPAMWLTTQGYSNVQAAFYWTSTTYAAYTSRAWLGNMFHDNVVNTPKTTTSSYVWPVRSVCSNNAVRIFSASPGYYSTVQSAYINSHSGDTIQSQEIELSENPDFNLPISVTLRGGYSCDYSTNSGQTIINGTMTIRSGTVTLENIIIQ